jgi:hypothetical protein
MFDALAFYEMFLITLQSKYVGISFYRVYGTAGSLNLSISSILLE